MRLIFVGQGYPRKLFNLEHFLIYGNALVPEICLTITCGIQPTVVVTMVMEVLHNSCNMCTLDLPDMYAYGPEG